MALLGARDDHRRPVGVPRLGVRGVDLGHVVAVDLDRAPPERLRPVAEHVGVPPVHRGTALSELVQVEDRRQAVEPVERGRLHGLPDRPFGHLGVAHHHPDVSRRAVEPQRERHPHADRQSLTERSGGDVDPRELRHRRRMPLDRRAEPTQRQHLLIGDGADRLQRRVQDGGGVALREHEPVVRQIGRLGDVRAQVIGVQDRDEVGGGHRGSGVSRARCRRASDAVDGELRREVVPELSPIVHPWLPFARVRQGPASLPPGRGTVSLLPAVYARRAWIHPPHRPSHPSGTSAYPTR